MNFFFVFKSLNSPSNQVRNFRNLDLKEQISVPHILPLNWCIQNILTNIGLHIICSLSFLSIQNFVFENLMKHIKS